MTYANIRTQEYLVKKTMQIKNFNLFIRIEVGVKMPGNMLWTQLCLDFYADFYLRFRFCAGRTRLITLSLYWIWNYL